MSQEIKKIIINQNLCIGCSNCEVITPGAFKLNEKRKADLLQNWNKVKDKDLKEASKSCPVKAIFLYNEKQKQIYP